MVRDVVALMRGQEGMAPNAFENIGFLEMFCQKSLTFVIGEDKGYEFYQKIIRLGPLWWPIGISNYFACVMADSFER